MCCYLILFVSLSIQLHLYNQPQIRTAQMTQCPLQHLTHAAIAAIAAQGPLDRAPGQGRVSCLILENLLQGHLLVSDQTSTNGTWNHGTMEPGII